MRNQSMIILLFSVFGGGVFTGFSLRPYNPIEQVAAVTFAILLGLLALANLKDYTGGWD